MGKSKSNLRWLGAVLGVAVLSASCGRANSAAALVFDRSASGTGVSVACGSEFEIRLPANPGSGYLWEFDELNERYLQFLGKQFVASRDVPPGATGWRVFRFKALKPGTTRLELEYHMRDDDSDDEGFGDYALDVEIIELVAE